MGILPHCLAVPTVEFYPLQPEHRVSTQAPLSLLIFPLVPSSCCPLVAVGAALSFPFSSWTILFSRILM